MRRRDDHHRMLRRLGALAVLSAVALVALAVPAWAHVDVEPTEAIAGSTQTLTFSVAFEGAATTGLVVQLPEGASVSEVPAKAGWTSTVDEAERTVSWSGGSVPDDETFAAVIVLPTTTGEVLFPAIQQTTDGEVAWIDSAEGEDHDTNPAPRLTLVADPDPTTTTEATTTSTTLATTTTDELADTTLEAQERDDGSTSAAPWIIGSALAAVAAIAIGGTLMKRRADREAADVSGDGADGGPGGDVGDGGDGG
jgi:uncharacterized protein YcnI